MPPLYHARQTKEAAEATSQALDEQDSVLKQEERRFDEASQDAHLNQTRARTLADVQHWLTEQEWFTEAHKGVRDERATLAPGPFLQASG